MVALRFGANTRIEWGGASVNMSSALCDWLIALGTARERKGAFVSGDGTLVVEKGRRVAFGAHDTNFKCCRGHVRSAEVFSGRLDLSCLLPCEL